MAKEAPLEAADEQRRQAAAAARTGRRSTMLTSLTDAQAGAPVTRKRLLGE
jgi:hypothetical protein